ncbi:MAG TPA: hypothetical protein VF139_00430 [Candidatus Polarisedimenticolaceae bacterium]
MELDVRLDPSSGNIEERASMTVEGRQTPTLRFRLSEELVVERTSADAGVVEHRRSGPDIVVTLDPPLDGLRTVSFLVSGRPMRGKDPRVAPERAVLGPWDAWYPALANTWGLAAVTVRAPKGWGVLAPGSPAGKPLDGVWSWKTAKPVRTLAIAGGPGLELTTTQVLGKPLRVLVAPGNAVRVAEIAERLRDGLAWLSGALAPYPFDGFNLALIPKADARARAGGFLAVPADVPVENASDGADLLSGQWFGERLAGDGPWMEAWASWQSGVFARDRALPLPADILRLRRAYFEMLSGDVPLARAAADTPETVLRGKGSAAPDMIRLSVDDRSFFAALRGLFERPVGAPIRLADIREAMERETQRSLTRPFEDWFEGRGSPELDASIRTFPGAGGGWRVDLTLVQKTGTYAIPVEVVFHGPGEQHRETINLETARFQAVYDLPFEPLRVELDPNRKIFRRP